MTGILLISPIFYCFYYLETFLNAYFSILFQRLAVLVTILLRRSEFARDRRPHRHRTTPDLVRSSSARLLPRTQ